MNMTIKSLVVLFALSGICYGAGNVESVLRSPVVTDTPAVVPAPTDSSINVLATIIEPVANQPLKAVTFLEKVTKIWVSYPYLDRGMMVGFVVSSPFALRYALSKSACCLRCRLDRTFLTSLFGTILGLFGGEYYGHHKTVVIPDKKK